MKSKILLSLFFITIFSPIKSSSISRNDVKKFAYAFIIANLFKNFIDNDKLEDYNKNILSLVALGSYAMYVNAISPYASKQRDTFATIGGLATGTLSHGGLCNLLGNLFMASIAFGILDHLIGN